MVCKNLREGRDWNLWIKYLFFVGVCKKYVFNNVNCIKEMSNVILLGSLEVFN